MITPTLVKPEVMAGAGFLDAHADEVYRLEADDLYLTGTSEVALAGYHADEILDLSDGAKRYAGWSTCYRREAGSYGKDTRGIIRVHQFNKVEMFVYCRPEDAEAEHERLLALEKEMLAKIEVPYRIIDTAAGDLGGPAARKYDCEAWVPTQGRYRELTSTSNCTTYQARRLNTRYRGREGHPDRGHAQRHAGHDPLARGDPGEPPAGRRLGRGAAGAAAVPRPRGAQARLAAGPGGVRPGVAPGVDQAVEVVARLGVRRLGEREHLRRAHLEDCGRVRPGLNTASSEAKSHSALYFAR